MVRYHWALTSLIAICTVEQLQAVENVVITWLRQSRPSPIGTFAERACAHVRFGGSPNPDFHRRCTVDALLRSTSNRYSEKMRGHAVLPFLATPALGWWDGEYTYDVLC